MTTTVSRRAFLKGAGATTAIGALTALGADLQPKVVHAQELRIKEAKTTPSICNYCAVGCALLVHSVGDTIVNIEGNPASPINFGNLCPKGAAVYQLHVNPNRLTKVLHRRPGGTQWEEMDLEQAMDRVAELVKAARDETFVEKLDNGKTVNMTPAVFSLGGALLDDEWNHIHQKLMRGLGIVAIENQARI
jgi:formate dehydrogenase major subunit